MLCEESRNGLYQIYSSEDIITEYSHHWRRQNPEVNDASRSVKLEMMRDAFVEVVFGFEIETPVGYPDKHDWHVHSAAIACGADAIVTDDKKLIAFGESALGVQQLSYDTISVDDFLMQLTEYADPRLFATVYLKQEAYYEGKTIQGGGSCDVNLPKALERAGAVKFADYLRRNIIPILPA